MSGHFSGRTALVTGAGSGLGEAIARQLAREGAAVVVLDRDGDAAARVVAAMDPERAMAITADVLGANGLDAGESRSGLRRLLHCFGGTKPLRRCRLTRSNPSLVAAPCSLIPLTCPGERAAGVNR